MSDMISVDDFDKVEMRAGTIADCKVNKKARKPAYALVIDFGELGIKKSSAQITMLFIKWVYSDGACNIISNCNCGDIALI